MGTKEQRAVFWGVLAAVCMGHAAAQNVVPDRIVPDTVVIDHQYETTDRFYRHLEEATEDMPLIRRLVAALVSDDDRLKTDSAATILEREVVYFSAFEGKRIDEIRIVRGDVYADHYARGDLRTLVNNLHIVTQESRIRRNLLFEIGERVDPLTFAQTEQLLRRQSYLSDASIRLVENPDGGEGVIVVVATDDAWSIGVTMRSAHHNRRYLDIYDSNFLGSGNRLDLRTYVSFRGDKYGGNMLQYRAGNLWGSFFELDLIGGWGYEEHDFGVRLNKEYLRPTDFIAGGAIEDRRNYQWETLNDTLPLVRSRNFEGWIGRSWAWPATHGSFYIGVRGQDLRFLTRPTVLPDSNTYYHSRRLLLVNTGIYRETYYRGNMIYGYGTTENIPYGHRFEFTGGRVWGEFGDRWYGAFDAAVGKQTKIGYFSAGTTLSTYWNEARKPVQGALELRFDGFSNLLEVGRSYLRQFLSLRYLRGFNRLHGEGEQLSFWQQNNPRGLRNQWLNANTRLIVKNETVLFSPIYFYGFRFVFFGFADLGWIGDELQPFKNDFYTTFGLGVRLKNERLIFSTIQLSLGVAINRHGWISDYRHFRFATQSSLHVPSFRAERPNVFEFR